METLLRKLRMTLERQEKAVAETKAQIDSLVKIIESQLSTVPKDDKKK